MRRGLIGVLSVLVLALVLVGGCGGGGDVGHEPVPRMMALATSLTLRPDGTGAYTGLSGFPSSGSNWEKVDDVSPDLTLTYVYTTESSQKKDAYTLTNHTTETGTINSVKVYFRIRIWSTYWDGTGYCQPFLRLGTSEVNGTEQSHKSVPWSTYSQTLPRPGGGSWSWTDIDNLQVGIKLRQSLVGAIYCTQVYVVVDYSANQAPVAEPQSGLIVNSCSTLTVTLTGSDPDSDPLTHIISTLPSHGDLYDGPNTSGHHIVPGDLPWTVLDSGNRTTYDPVDSYGGADSFGFKVNDGTVDSTEATISITVTLGCTTYYRDNDNDGYGQTGDSQCLCAASDPYDTTTPGDCDDTAAGCTTDCTTDVDSDGIPDCKDTCIDVDGDGYGVGAGCTGTDCDDTAASCTTDCTTDVDSDGMPDCKDTCIDVDGDGYGAGAGCSGADCDDAAASCTTDCTTDVDSDGIPDCKDTCIDVDGDGYGVGAGCTGADCDDTAASCTTDCTTDVDSDGIPDCKDPSICADADGDGYGVGAGCTGTDCDDTRPTCTTNCTDADSDGTPDCADTCIDVDGDGYGVGAGCTGSDCDDSDNTIHPGAPELFDGKDNDCDGNIDEGYAPVTGPILHILLLYSTEGGTATGSGGAIVAYPGGVSYYYPGTVVNLTATPDAGYRFVNWTGDVDTIADINDASTTITMNGDCSITANFVAVYELTISSTEGGSVTEPGEGTFTYNAGTVADLVAKADSGYKFVNWTGNVTTIANVNGATTTTTMKGDYSIVANFAQIPPGQVTLTVSSSAVGPIITTPPSTTGGSVTTPGEATFAYDEGTVVDLEAEPEESWRFVMWIGDVDDVADVTAASTTITMNEDYSITAVFKFGTGCFIATAAYGTPMAQEIQILREFRDEYMLSNPVGETLVELYYRVSPPIADFITEHPGLRPTVRVGLAPAVAMSTLAVNTSLAPKVAIAGLLLLSLAVAIWASRRRAKGARYA